MLVGGGNSNYGPGRQVRFGILSMAHAPRTEGGWMGRWDVDGEEDRASGGGDVGSDVCLNFESGPHS